LLSVYEWILVDLIIPKAGALFVYCAKSYVLSRPVYVNIIMLTKSLFIRLFIRKPCGKFEKIIMKTTMRTIRMTIIPERTIHRLK
ncbi:MAG: hypothetical protein IJH81_11140, partial [Lachnospiraceae bacterium]|nr:hypothetical protein [Lachnospiraceae bacterium]